MVWGKLPEDPRGGYGFLNEPEHEPATENLKTWVQDHLFGALAWRETSTKAHEPAFAYCRNPEIDFLARICDEGTTRGRSHAMRIEAVLVANSESSREPFEWAKLDALWSETLQEGNSVVPTSLSQTSAIGPTLLFSRADRSLRVAKDSSIRWAESARQREVQREEPALPKSPNASRPVMPAPPPQPPRESSKMERRVLVALGIVTLILAIVAWSQSDQIDSIQSENKRLLNRVDELGKSNQLLKVRSFDSVQARMSAEDRLAEEQLLLENVEGRARISEQSNRDIEEKLRRVRNALTSPETVSRSRLLEIVNSK
ncbi:MAG: hypothetical protein V3W41_08435 [Planctomycetota bacterium]